MDPTKLFTLRGGKKNQTELKQESVFNEVVDVKEHLRILEMSSLYGQHCLNKHEGSTKEGALMSQTTRVSKDEKFVCRAY